MNSLKEYNMGMDFTVKTFAGLEQALFDELTELGAENLEIIKRGVTFRGDLAMMYKVNYMSRLAIRILKPIGVFEVLDENQLYDKVKNINWMDVFKINQTFSVDSNLFYSNLDHSHYVSQKTKDAIVDQFREATGKRPWVSLENPDIYIDVHISHNVCTISLDSSGESLHKRGYRIATDKAPINEVLAAGMLNISGWKGKEDLYDPMCGSGTISIEAAMLAMKIPAGYYRKKFAFMNWEHFDEEMWKSVKSDADDLMEDLECNIYASDRSDKAVGIAKRNFRSAGLHKDLNIEQSYFDAVQPKNKSGVIIMNPPYGMRLEERGELRDLYRGIGDVLKNTFTGFESWIISPNFETLKFIGLKPSKRITLFNGPIETKLMKFEVYEGTRRYGDRNSDDFKRKDKHDSKKEWSSDRKFSDRKFPDKKFSDEKFSDKKFSDKKFGDKKFSDKKFSDKKFGDKKFSDKKFSDRKPFGKHEGEGFERKKPFRKNDGEGFERNKPFRKNEGEGFERKNTFDKKYDRPDNHDDFRDDTKQDNPLKELEKRSQNFEKHLESIRRFSKPTDNKKRRKRINKKPPSEDKE